MGAAAVLETAAEIPPIMKSIMKFCKGSVSSEVQAGTLLPTPPNFLPIGQNAIRDETCRSNK
jgi:hypothetical protein